MASPLQKTQGCPVRLCRCHAVKKLAEGAQTVFTEDPCQRHNLTGSSKLEGRSKEKSERPDQKQKARRINTRHFKTAFVFLLLTFLHLSKPFKRNIYHESSAPACLSVFCEFWRSMKNVPVEWAPCVFYRAQLTWRPFLVTLCGC